ncbi:unnamed protein product, partial [Nippostrongylus brasiliensis]|uniref:Uncharacterized protein n=1 Tax=Nippostrongylus brasiliensis TaxID=27835 RepID=A0A0N4XC99_NIPBR
MVNDIQIRFGFLALFTVVSVAYYSISMRGSDHESQETYVRVPLNLTFEKSIFDTCPLFIPDPLAPELRRFHDPWYNPKKDCIPYRPLTTLKNGSISVSDKAHGYDCYA